MISTIHFYFCALLSKICGRKTKSALAYKKLTGISFSLTEKDRYSYRSLLAGIKKVYYIPVRKQKEKNLVGSGSSIVYDLSASVKANRFEFLKFYGIKEDLIFISSDELQYFNSTLEKMFFIVLSIPVQLQVMLFGIFKKDRSGLSRILLNLLITKNGFDEIRKAKSKKIFMFSIYDTNSSFLSYFLMKKGITVSQVASEVPLYKWNKIIVTNELILCSEYQKYELSEFKETIKLDDFKMFGPELYYKVFNLYKNKPEGNNKVGFYSTGGWIRKKLGHIDQGVDIEFFEEKILRDINLILKERMDIRLVVYPHPREWAYFDNSETKMKDLYAKFLTDIEFGISERGKATDTVFDEVYLALCYMTTVIFERLHAGRKSAIVYFKEKGFPVKNDLKNLKIIDNESELRNLILSCY